MNKVFCDLCDTEVKQAHKEDGIWICPDCDNKYPKEKEKQ